MKKLVFMFVAVAAISFASCGNKAQAPAEEPVDTIPEVIDSLDSDTVQNDTTANDTVK